MATMETSRPLAAPENGQASGAHSRPNDLAFLLHAANARMADHLDRAAVEIGLRDMRDWLVLAALADGEQANQLELSRIVCVDKSTLISVLDRLEKQKLVTRTVAPTDRRVRIPRITSAGKRVHAQFAVARDAAETRAFDGIPSAQRKLMLSMLARVAECDLAEA
ncbi:DNA-binding MarR family transcriptional regulator [Nocardia tenerifensis]|uniref:DNA-binding MarR family transcriptional regulator n=2 Tax=Nocardia tenerifensis TaxID=228006 RepID=A0A318KC64_9NOCA|nr:DNA-binding MarR family transcriptional regulator [Nocardia tenerifensis]